MILQQSVTWSIHKAYRQFFRELTVLKRTLVQKKKQSTLKKKHQTS